MDDLSAHYAELVTGSYDCVDRIVVNAYFGLGHNPGWFRVWWRRWHDDSDDSLDDAHLMRLAGRFARRVRAWADANKVPVITCRAGERKHRIAEDYLATHMVGIGVFLILVAKAPATVWKVTRSTKTGSGVRPRCHRVDPPVSLQEIARHVGAGGVLWCLESVLEVCKRTVKHLQ